MCRIRNQASHVDGDPFRHCSCSGSNDCLHRTRRKGKNRIDKGEPCRTMEMALPVPVPGDTVGIHQEGEALVVVLVVVHTMVGG